MRPLYGDSGPTAASGAGVSGGAVSPARVAISCGMADPGSGIRLAGAAGHVVEAKAQAGDVLVESRVQNLDTARRPGQLIQLIRLVLDGPRLVAGPLECPDLEQDCADVPVAEAVPQEQEVAVLELRQERCRDVAPDVAP